ncbi:MAG TPA: dTDP-4-dehydrorhamnose reductase [Gammaproteobacteria bacterium]|nr:dTDP-4-dehydrorhamnose reductase [Gammaproteobacteria bacterium]
MTVLVLGENGQLAMHLREVLPQAAFWGRRTLDLARPAAVADAISALRPTAIVNAAGYTAVDKAESEPDLAWRVNAESVAAVARTANALGVPLVHVSTDYVFDGTKTGEYEEGDALNPVSVYGVTKAAGELAVRALCPSAWVLRVSWLFSEHGANFMKTMLRLAATLDELRVVDDQRGRPTYAGQFAQLVARLIERGESDVTYGVYHAVGGPVVSWRDFALATMKRAHERGLLPRQPPVRGIRTSEYPTAARRPANSALRPSAALERLGVALDWSAGLDEALGRLAKT